MGVSMLSLMLSLIAIVTPVTPWVGGALCVAAGVTGLRIGQYRLRERRWPPGNPWIVPVVAGALGLWLLCGGLPLITFLPIGSY